MRKMWRARNPLIGRSFTPALFIVALVYSSVPWKVDAQVLGDATSTSTARASCAKPDVAQSSNPVTRDLRSGYRDIAFDLCRVVKEDNTQLGAVQELLVDVFTGRGLHLASGTIVPGSGNATGFALNDEWNLDDPVYARFTTSVEARGSGNGFWAAGAVAHLQIHWYELRDIGSSRTAKLTFAVKHMELPALPFYGLGDQTSLRNRAVFGLTQTAFPMSLDLPAPGGFTVSGQASILQEDPHPSSRFHELYGETSAPGSHGQTYHAVPGFAVAWRSPDTSYGWGSNARVSYEAYRNLAGGHFSFDRLEGQWAVHYGFDDPVSAEFSRILSGILATSRVSFETNIVLSDPRAHNSVPFYLQPSLGGGDIHNSNLLRSYTDYRFRGRDLVAYGVTYDKRLINPVGLFVFTQFGKVAADASDLGFDKLKRSIGAGLSFRLGGKAVAEISLSWGGSEGMQFYSTGNTNNAIGFGARAAATVGLRGVF